MKVADLFARLSLRTNKRSFSRADRMLSTVKTALVGIAAFKTVRWFGGLISDTAQAADMFAKMSKQVGISVEGLQQLEFAAQISGTGLQELRTGLQRFARNASDVERGLQTAKDAFRDAGVKATDARGQLRPLDEMLMDVADSFARMEDGTKKTALAQELFGRAGAKLIPLLNEGRGGIQKLREEFVALGGQIDGETAKSFEEFNDDSLRVKIGLQAIRNQAVIALLPTLKRMVKAVLAWQRSNKGLIKQRLQSVLGGLVFVLRTLGTILGTVIDFFVAFHERTGLLVPLFKALVIGIVAFKIASIAAAVASGAAWLLSLLPLLLVAAAIVAVGLILEDLYQAFAGGESVFKRFFEAAQLWLGDKLNKVADAAAENLVEILEFLDAPGAGEARKRLEATRRVEQIGAEKERTRELVQERTLRARKALEEAKTPEERVRAREELIAQTEAAFHRAGTEAPPGFVEQQRSAINAEFNINIDAPGGDAGEIAAQARAGLEQAWSTIMRDTAAATGQ